MKRIYRIALALVAVPLISHHQVLAQQQADHKKEEPATKAVKEPLARRESISAIKISDTNAVSMEMTSTVMVPSQEQREATRTVCKTVTEPKEETYTVDVKGNCMDQFPAIHAKESQRQSDRAVVLRRGLPEVSSPVEGIEFTACFLSRQTGRICRSQLRQQSRRRG